MLTAESRVRRFENAIRDNACAVIALDRNYQRIHRLKAKYQEAKEQAEEVGRDYTNPVEESHFRATLIDSLKRLSRAEKNLERANADFENAVQHADKTEQDYNNARAALIRAIERADNAEQSVSTRQQTDCPTPHISHKEQFNV